MDHAEKTKRIRAATRILNKRLRLPIDECIQRAVDVLTGKLTPAEGLGVQPVKKKAPRKKKDDGGHDRMERGGENREADSPEGE